MAEFTKEQLIACAETALSDARTAANFHDSKPYHQMRVHLAEIALAALTAAPFGFTEGEGHGMCYEPRHADRLNYPSAVYRLPLLEGLK